VSAYLEVSCPPTWRSWCPLTVGQPSPACSSSLWP